MVDTYGTHFFCLALICFTNISAFRFDTYHRQKVDFFRLGIIKSFHSKKEKNPAITYKVNDMIISDCVRLIVPGENMWDEVVYGIVPLDVAKQKAHELKLDLIEINGIAEPPVCRIIDHGKFMFKMMQKKKDERHKQSRVGLKEIKMTSTIEQHDFDVRFKSITKFLAEGNRVSQEYF